LKSRSTVLVVDDEEFVRESLVDLLQSEGYRALTAGGVKEALEVLEKESANAIVTDLRMPSGSGIELIEEARKRGAEAPIIVLTGAGTVGEAVAAMKVGAYDFIQKPVDPEQFVLLISRAIQHQDLVSTVTYLKKSVEDLRGPTEMVGSSPALTVVRALIGQVAPTDATVLITGESGTGKELVAAEVHRLSERHGENFVRVNCAAISENLFESEFFGHRRGAFTSAVSDRAGRFAEAEGGTLVLDEIGTLKPEMQAKLLRVLETGEYQVVGESRTRVASVRVIAITNEDLASMVREGTFRKDLYYRLNIFPIEVPPLRKRKEDIPALALHFLRRARTGPARPAQGSSEEMLPPAARQALLDYDWPGNVRELRNVMERASILSGPRPIEAPVIQAIVEASMRVDGRPAEDEGLNVRRRVDALERQLIAEALSRASGKKREAAALLGIDPKNLGYYLRKHGVAGGATEASEESAP
jgi:DNA-binding NtrC family response regulator